MKKVGDKLSYDANTIMCRGSWGTNIFLGLLQKNHEKSDTINVAVKRLQRSNLKQKSLSDIENESIMKVTAHPNILHYICAEMDDNFLYLATDLFAGTLQSLVEGKYDGPTVGDEREILRQITNGLAYLHGLNIIHRDINPKNIYISKLDDRSGLPPRMKLADFGFCTVLFTNSNQIDNDFETSSVKASQREETINSAGQIYRNPLGTEGWMAPELFHSDHYDFKVDIWALGCIIGYTLSRGRHPFGSNYIVQSIQIKNQKPMIMVLADFKSSYAEDDLLAIFNLMQSMLVVDPACRPTVDAVINDHFFKNNLSCDNDVLNIDKTESIVLRQECEQSKIAKDTYETIPFTTNEPMPNPEQEKKRLKEDYTATKGEAKQIIFFDKENKLNLNKVELEKILDQEHVKGLPIVVLSVIGANRTGKSFLLSWLVHYFKARVKTPDWLEQHKQQEGTPLSNFFPWKSGFKAETLGIWAWSEVFIVDGLADEKVGVLLIDTQGLVDANNTSKQESKMFTLSTLMSSIQILNVSQKMQENYLENFQLFSEFGRRALLTHNSDFVSNKKPFQRMVFLIRDWQCPKEYPFGSEGGQQYINSYLKATNNNGVEKRELIERRKHVRECFSQVQCFLMPHPGKKVANDESNFGGKSSDMKAIFQDHLKELAIFLFPRGAVEPKKWAGNPILAGDVLGHVEVYLNLLNSDESLSPQSVYQAMAIIHNNTVAKNAIKEYKTYVTAIEKEFIDTFLTDADIEVKHSKAKEKALDYFGKHKMGDVESNSEILKELNKDINDEFENWKNRNEGAKVNILRLNDFSLNDAEKMYSTFMNDWLRSATPFATSEELFMKHQEIQETTENYLKNQLKGPIELTTPINDRLKKLIEEHFLSDIVPKNEGNKRHELNRLEIIRLEDLRITGEEEVNRLRAGNLQSIIGALTFVLLVVLVTALAEVALPSKPKQEPTSSWVSLWVEFQLSVSNVINGIIQRLL